jgi:hypothetical protein
MHPVGQFPHPKHLALGFACGKCHTPPAMDASGMRCADCHGAHHQAGAECRACHADDVKVKHPGAMVHGACSACHGEKVAGIAQWSRKVCTVCHTDRVEHNAPASCELCHTVPPPPGGGGGGGA